MNFLLKLRLVTFFVIVTQTITACHGGTRSQTPQEQSGELTATFTAEEYTLSLTTSCKSVMPECPFRAEISAPSALFELIQQVEYTYLPDRPKSPAPITDTATGFRFEGTQTGGEKVSAAVTLRARDGAPSKVVQIEGTIPFAVEVTPPLPAGLRFEINYRPWYLEGVPHEPVEYLFKIRLRGEATAFKRIKSVEYRLPADDTKRPRILQRSETETEYFLEGSMPNTEGVVIVAVIRWKSGGNSTHMIPLRPRL